MSTDVNMQTIHDKFESQIMTIGETLDTLKALAKTETANVEIKAIAELLAKKQVIQQELQELKKLGGNLPRGGEVDICEPYQVRHTVHSEDRSYSLETIMLLQKVLESGIPEQLAAEEIPADLEGLEGNGIPRPFTNKGSHHLRQNNSLGARTTPPVSADVPDNGCQITTGFVSHIVRTIEALAERLRKVMRESQFNSERDLMRRRRWEQGKADLERRIANFEKSVQGIESKAKAS